MAEAKQGLVDAWTPTHVVFGAATRYAGFSPLQALGLWVTFEILENVIGETKTSKDFFPLSGAESLTNIIGDLMANLAGYAAVDIALPEKSKLKALAK